MGLNNGINVRLDPDIRDRLETIAAKYGVKASVLIRQAISEKLDQVEGQPALVISAKNPQDLQAKIRNVRSKLKAKDPAAVTG